MKEYKRCKYCSMEMDKSAIKCPHCKKVQTTKFSLGDKSENLLITILIAIAILVGFSGKFSNIQSSIDSLSFSFASLNPIEKIQIIPDFFAGDYENHIIEVNAEDVVFEFEEDSQSSYDYYHDSLVRITGDITYINYDYNSKYIYLDTGISSYSICICIPIKDISDVDYLNIGDSITYEGIFYMENSDDYDIYLIDGSII